MPQLKNIFKNFHRPHSADESKAEDLAKIERALRQEGLGLSDIMQVATAFYRPTGGEACLLMTDIAGNEKRVVSPFSRDGRGGYAGIGRTVAALDFAVLRYPFKYLDGIFAVDPHMFGVWPEQEVFAGESAALLINVRDFETRVYARGQVSDVVKTLNEARAAHPKPEYPYGLNL